jgi:hypothetical protein
MASSWTETRAMEAFQVRVRLRRAARGGRDACRARRSGAFRHKSGILASRTARSCALRRQIRHLTAHDPPASPLCPVRHAQIDVTMDVYTEVTDEQKLRAFKRLGQQLDSKGNALLLSR